MANYRDRVLENAPGPYYNDDTCIDCDLCRSTAPEIFRRNDQGGYSYVHHQPETADEMALAEEARLGCPTDTIGNDGAVTSPSEAGPVRD